jgi:hypothetical protein
MHDEESSPLPPDRRAPVRLLGAPDLVVTANLRWLAGYRHPRHRLPAARAVRAPGGPAGEGAAGRAGVGAAPGGGRDRAATEPAARYAAPAGVRPGGHVGRRRDRAKATELGVSLRLRSRDSGPPFPRRWDTNPNARTPPGCGRRSARGGAVVDLQDGGPRARAARGSRDNLVRGAVCTQYGATLWRGGDLFGLVGLLACAPVT